LVTGPLGATIRDLYRIVKPNPPTEADFVSFGALGRPVPMDPEVARLWWGVSVYDTERGARKTARRRPHLGRYMARLEIPDDAPVRVERKGHGASHHTVWAEPATLFACAVEVLPMAAD
jgi:hypothetical protein